MLIVNGWSKIIEEDDYLDGCSGLSEMLDGYETFKSENINDLLEQLLDFSGQDDVLLNSCEEAGRIDIQGLENEDGYYPNERELEEWRAGEINLYCVTYTFYVLECRDYLIPEYI